MKLHIAFSVTVLGVVCVASAQNMTVGTYTLYDLTPVENADAQWLTGGGNYPIGTEPLSVQATVSGVPLGFSDGYTTAYGTGIVSLGWGNNQTSATLNIGQSNVAAVYTFINSAFGAYGTDIGNVTLNGSTGAQQYELVEGLTIRDHYSGYFNNVATGVQGTAYFSSGIGTTVTPGLDIPGGDRVDMQEILVNPGIGTLQSITFNSYNTGGGDPLVFGVTTQATPEPASLAVFGIGLSALAFRRRRNS